MDHGLLRGAMRTIKQLATAVLCATIGFWGCGSDTSTTSPSGSGGADQGGASQGGAGQGGAGQGGAGQGGAGQGGAGQGAQGGSSQGGGGQGGGDAIVVSFETTALTVTEAPQEVTLTVTLSTATPLAQELTVTIDAAGTASDDIVSGTADYTLPNSFEVTFAQGSDDGATEDLPAFTIRPDVRREGD